MTTRARRILRRRRFSIFAKVRTRLARTWRSGTARRWSAAVEARIKPDLLWVNRAAHTGLCRMGRWERGKGPNEDARLYRIHNALFRRLTGRHKYQFDGTCAVSVSLVLSVSLSANQGCLHGLHAVPRAPNARAREDRDRSRNCPPRGRN